jgi:hypothetical protein
MSDEHERGDRKHNFCSVPAKPKCSDCPGSKDYIEVCKPSGWFNHTFMRLVRKKTGDVTFDKKYEAHHMVCVSPVTTQLTTKKGIQSVIAQTVWCINNKKNMIALPLWGHTVMWYCTITAEDDDTATDMISDLIKKRRGEPAFADLPQHDWDHNGNGRYTSEVDADCLKLAKQVAESGHKLKGQDLTDKLDALSNKYKGILKARGNRCGGTHAAWKQGQKDPESNWGQPFSMASTSKLSKKGFPARSFDKSVAKWIKRIAEAIATGGGV